MISRNGDLINAVYLQVELPALQDSYMNVYAAQGGTPAFTAGTATAVVSDLAALSYTNSIGHALIESVTISVGGQQIDKHYGVWLEIWNELTQTSEKEAGFNAMVGNYAEQEMLKDSSDLAQVIYVPLQFWFCRNPGLALPLIALQYHEVKIDIEFRPVLECLVGLKTDGNRIATTTVSSGAAGEGYALSSDGRANIKFTHAQLYVDRLVQKSTGQNPVLVY